MNLHFTFYKLVTLKDSLYHESSLYSGSLYRVTTGQKIVSKMLLSLHDQVLQLNQVYILMLSLMYPLHCDTDYTQISSIQSVRLRYKDKDVINIIV